MQCHKEKQKQKVTKSKKKKEAKLRNNTTFGNSIENAVNKLNVKTMNARKKLKYR